MAVHQVQARQLQIANHSLLRHKYNNGVSPASSSTSIESPPEAKICLAKQPFAIELWPNGTEHEMQTFPLHTSLLLLHQHSINAEQCQLALTKWQSALASIHAHLLRQLKRFATTKIEQAVYCHCNLQHGAKFVQFCQCHQCCTHSNILQLQIPILLTGQDLLCKYLLQHGSKNRICLEWSKSKPKQGSLSILLIGTARLKQ